MKYQLKRLRNWNKYLKLIEFLEMSIEEDMQEMGGEEKAIARILLAIVQSTKSMTQEARIKIYEQEKQRREKTRQGTLGF